MTGGRKGERIHVALLRGINVGGRNRLPMQDLAAVFTEIGCNEVQTYIQSGNVVYEAPRALAPRVPDLVAAELSARFGLGIAVVTRTAAELRKTAAGNPFLDSNVDPTHLHVAFLAGRPERADVAALDPDRSPPDRFEVVGREVYLHFPKGVARSKLTNVYFDRVLRTTSTARNWKTTLRLVEMTRRS